jgi:hypothetical protein
LRRNEHLGGFRAVRVLRRSSLRIAVLVLACSLPVWLASAARPPSGLAMPAAAMATGTASTPPAPIPALVAGPPAAGNAGTNAGPALVATAGLAADRSATATPVAVGTTAPAAVLPTTTPTASPDGERLALATFWDRLRRLEYLPAIDRLQPLSPGERADPLFGVAEALGAGDAAGPIMRGMGAAVDRLELRWDQLEPAPGVYDFTALDDTLAMNDQIGFSVLAVVDGTPDWATPDALAPGNAPPIGLDQPVFLAGGAVNPNNPWAGFLATVAAHYGARIGAWEIWNEPNSNVFWNGTPSQYARLLAVAQAVLAKAAPAKPVLIGGMVSDDGAFLSAVAAALCPAGPCGGVFPSAVAWHVYDNPADIVRLAGLTRRLLQPYAVTPEVWITEANVPVNDPQAPDDAVVGQDAVSLNGQAAFVLQSYALARLAGVHTLVIYRASDVDDQGHYWGLLRGDDSARPALLAYRTAAQWLGGTRAIGLSHPQSGVSVAQFCGNDNRVDVAWNDTTARVDVALPAVAARADQVDAAGAAVPLTPVQGAWRVALPPATAPTAFTVALGLPTLVVQAGGCAT